MNFNSVSRLFRAPLTALFLFAVVHPVLPQSIETTGQHLDQPKRCIIITTIAILWTAFPVDGQANNKSAQSNPHVDSNEGYFTGADGVRLFYRKVGNGRSSAVFLHGGPGSNFRGNGDFMEPFAARRTLIMYDQRGSGLSEIVTDPKLLTAKHHIRDLEALRQHFGIKRMTVIGSLMGFGFGCNVRC
ncbi:MAG: alpha/beta fold hydrolase [Pyrinomonadaceae bacterium]